MALCLDNILLREFLKRPSSMAQTRDIFIVSNSERKSVVLKGLPPLAYELFCLLVCQTKYAVNLITFNKF